MGWHLAVERGEERDLLLQYIVFIAHTKRTMDHKAIEVAKKLANRDPFTVDSILDDDGEDNLLDICEKAGLQHKNAACMHQIAAIMQQEFLSANKAFPVDLDHVASLPGFACKSASCVILGMTGKAPAIALDTHVFQMCGMLTFHHILDKTSLLAGLMGADKNKQEEIRLILQNIFTENQWIAVNEISGSLGQMLNSSECDEIIEETLEDSRWEEWKIKARRVVEPKNSVALKTAADVIHLLVANYRRKHGKNNKGEKGLISPKITRAGLEKQEPHGWAIQH
jgi:endonuclease III